MIDEKEKQLLKHMLGADERYEKSLWGFRNRYLADKKDDDFIRLREMERKGYVKSYDYNDDMMFCATRKGAVAIGFEPEQLNHTYLPEES